MKEKVRVDRITYDRFFEIPEKGKDDGYVLTQTRKAARHSVTIFETGCPAAKPGTKPKDITLEARNTAARITAENLIDGKLFPGAYNRQEEVIAMTARLFGKDGDDRELGAGVLLSGGTESLNQALWMYRNKYYMDILGKDIRTKGVGEAQTELLKETGRAPRPRILCPVNYHFSIAKAADLLGLGTGSIAYYGLDGDFDADLDSLERTLREIYEAGDDVILNCIVAGDTSKGKVHDNGKIAKVIKRVSEEYGKKPPDTLVDAAGAGYFIGVMQDNPKYGGKIPLVSFKQEDVVAVIVDPHKQPIPYSCGMLMIRDFSMFNYTDSSKFSLYVDAREDVTHGGSQEDRLRWNALATIPTSRAGDIAHAVWAYYLSEGLEEIRKKKERIWSLVQNFKEYINDSEHFELVCEPQTQIVAFRFKGAPKDNFTIYNNIKHNEYDFHCVSHDEGMLVRTPEELKETQKNDYDNRYCGLFVTITEHNTKKTLDELKTRLAEEAGLL